MQSLVSEVERGETTVVQTQELLASRGVLQGLRIQTSGFFDAVKELLTHQQQLLSHHQLLADLFSEQLPFRLSVQEQLAALARQDERQLRLRQLGGLKKQGERWAVQPCQFSLDDAGLALLHSLRAWKKNPLFNFYWYKRLHNIQAVEIPQLVELTELRELFIKPTVQEVRLTSLKLLGNTCPAKELIHILNELPELRRSTSAFVDAFSMILTMERIPEHSDDLEKSKLVLEQASCSTILWEVHPRFAELGPDESEAGGVRAAGAVWSDSPLLYKAQLGTGAESGSGGNRPNKGNGNGPRESVILGRCLKN